MTVTNVPCDVKLYTIIKAAGIIKACKNSFTSSFAELELLGKIAQLSWQNVTQKDWVKPADDEQLQDDLALSDTDDEGCDEAYDETCESCDSH